MEQDALRQLARKAYRKEYVAKTTIGFREKSFLYPAAALLKGGAWVAGIGLAGLVFGFASIAAPVFAAGMIAIAVSLPLLHTGSTLVEKRADLALERDIDNGMLIDSYKRQFAPQPSAEASVSVLSTQAIKDAFNKPVTTAPPVAAPAPVLKPQPAHA
jgi:hypothetical protein